MNDLPFPGLVLVKLHLAGVHLCQSRTHGFPNVEIEQKSCRKDFSEGKKKFLQRILIVLCKLIFKVHLQIYCSKKYPFCI